MPSSSMNLKDCDPKVIFAHIQDEKPRKVPQKLGFSSKSNPTLDPTKQISKFSGNKIKQTHASWWLQSIFSKYARQIGSTQ